MQDGGCAGTKVGAKEGSREGVWASAANGKAPERQIEHMPTKTRRHEVAKSDLAIWVS